MTNGIGIGGQHPFHELLTERGQQQRRPITTRLDGILLPSPLEAFSDPVIATTKVYSDHEFDGPNHLLEEERKSATIKEQSNINQTNHKPTTPCNNILPSTVDDQHFYHTL